MKKWFSACRALLLKFPDDESRFKVLLSHVCAIYRSSRNRNVVLCAKENPNFSLTMEHNPPHVMLRTGVTSSALISPYFFNASFIAKT